MINIYFDGGCDPNPGKGYGSYEVQCESDPMLNHKALRQQFGDRMTCNMAEYFALIAALKWLSHRDGRWKHGLKIWTDSMLVKNQVQGAWKAKVWILKDLRNEVRTLLEPYQHPRWQIFWRPRKFNVERFGH